MTIPLTQYRTPARKQLLLEIIIQSKYFPLIEQECIAITKEMLRKTKSQFSLDDQALKELEHQKNRSVEK